MFVKSNFSREARILTLKFNAKFLTKQTNFFHSNNNKNSNTQLVVWGTNLGSTAGGYGQLKKEISDSVAIPPYQCSIFVGLLLSNGWLSLPYRGAREPNARFGFRLSYTQLDYIWSVFNDISFYCNRYPYSYVGVRKGTPFHIVTLTTQRLPCFTELYSMFYFNKKKILPQNVYNILTPVALAHWIMGSGKKLQGRGLRLCADSFSIPEVVTLMNVLIIKYRLVCTLQIDKDKPVIYIPRNSMETLITYVKPYIISKML